MSERAPDRSTFVPRPRAEVPAFFADPANLQVLTRRIAGIFGGDAAASAGGTG